LKHDADVAQGRGCGGFDGEKAVAQLKHVDRRDTKRLCGYISTEKMPWSN